MIISIITVILLNFDRKRRGQNRREREMHYLCKRHTDVFNLRQTRKRLHFGKNIQSLAQNNRRDLWYYSRNTRDEQNIGFAAFQKMICSSLINVYFPTYQINIFE